MREDRGIVNSVFSMREDTGIVSTASGLCEKTGVLLTQCFVYTGRKELLWTKPLVYIGRQGYF